MRKAVPVFPYFFSLTIMQSHFLIPSQRKQRFFFYCSAIGSLYSDAGLLGAMVVCEAAAAGKIVSAVAAALRSATVTETEVAASKKNLMADVYAVQGTAASLVEDIGTQVRLPVLVLTYLYLMCSPQRSTQGSLCGQLAQSPLARLASRPVQAAIAASGARVLL